MRRLVVFSGIDGAGKTTQIDLLTGVMQAKGHVVVRFWARGGYTPVFMWAKSLLRRTRLGVLPPPGQSTTRGKRLRSPMVRRTWINLSLLDLLLCYGLWLRWQLALGRTVICDRYIEDTLMDFDFNFPDERIESRLLWRLLRRAAPQPDLAFMLLVPPEESARRSLLKNDRFPNDLANLEWRYRRYRELVDRGGWCAPDCLQPVNAVHRVVTAAAGY